MNCRLIPLLWVHLVMSVGPGAVFAGDLLWDETAISVEPAAKAKGVEVKFVFTNTSSSPVEIEKVSTSCGCTTAKLSKNRYEPGEKGELPVNFVFGNRTGDQEKSILVRIGDGPPDVLLLRVKIPDVVEFSPSELTWDVGGSVKEQSFTVNVLEPGVRVTGSRAMGRVFAATMEEVEAAVRYQIVVQPLDLSRAVRGSVRVELETPKPRVIYLPVRVVRRGS